MFYLFFLKYLSILFQATTLLGLQSINIMEIFGKNTGKGEKTKEKESDGETTEEEEYGMEESDPDDEFRDHDAYNEYTPYKNNEEGEESTEEEVESEDEEEEEEEEEKVI